MKNTKRSISTGMSLWFTLGSGQNTFLITFVFKILLTFVYVVWVVGGGGVFWLFWLPCLTQFFIASGLKLWLRLRLGHDNIELFYWPYRVFFETRIHCSILLLWNFPVWLSVEVASLLKNKLIMNTQLLNRTCTFDFGFVELMLSL